ncbi:MAG TPA: DUF3857 and transglutaminase domain-containing protein [Rhodothermales bacterium]|nr:DUF3857 and transglutaminase domain-containing protein [Rhodothermales bacterium]
MKYCTPLIACAILLFPAHLLQAQPDPIRWGKVTEAELNMDSFPADTNAAAVIRADYGTVAFEHDWSYRFIRHRRIKILSQAGYDWGTFSIAYYAVDDFQRVSHIRGQTITRGENGKPEFHKLERSSIFDEDIDGEYKRVRFTLPALEPGAIVEYMYTVTTESPAFLPRWEFQASEPTLWSEFRPEIPGTLAYVRATRGTLPFDISEKTPLTRPYGPSTQYRFVMKDVPALRDEPYMTTPEDYRAQIEFQLGAYHDGQQARKFLPTWDELAERLMQDDLFGGRLGRGKAVHQHVQTLTAGLDDPREKLAAIYDFVRTSIHCTGEPGVYLDHELSDVLRSKSGSEPEVNLLLVSMLREAGLNANPVLISTRSHGSVIDVYPILSQFNAVIGAVRIGGETIFLDATDPLRPYTLLPTDDLNGKGWVVREEGAAWSPISAAGRLRRQSLLLVRLDSLGRLSGNVQTSDFEYAALDRRSALNEKGDEEKFVQDVILNGLADIQLDSLHIEGADDIYAPLKSTVTFSESPYALAAGDLIYLNPVALDRMAENPLRLPERTFPVDFAYPRDLTYSARFELPAGYSVVESPHGARISMSSGGAMYERSVDVQGHAINVSTRFVIGKAVFTAGQYPELRKFFDAVVAAEAQQVVLKRGSGEQATSTVQ